MKRRAEPCNSDSASETKHGRHDTNDVIATESDRFDIFPLSRFNREFPFFRQPFELGSFSLDANRTFVNNKSQLRTYKPPNSDVNVNWNLRYGYDTFLKRDDSVNEYLDHLLEWINANKKLAVGVQCGSSNDGVDSLNADFVCWRGILTKLLCTPYENRDGWKIVVSRFGKTLYICEFEADNKNDDGFKNSEIQKEMTYWGFKFETYITALGADGVPEPEQPVNNHQAYVSVVRTRLSSHSLLFGGEVDCCDQNNSSAYIELKTNRMLETPNQHRSFKRYKLIKWWAQSFLIGIPKVVCGFRDDNGVVRQLKDFRTADMPKSCQDLRDGWTANVCFNFLDQFLQYLKDTVQHECDRINMTSPGLGYRHVVLTGSPGVGKTTLIRKTCEALKSKCCPVQGFYTEECREKGVRVGFDVVTLDGQRSPLARAGDAGDRSSCRVGKYGVLVQSFEKTALPALSQPVTGAVTPVFVVDEIGKMELFSSSFKKLLSQVLNNRSISLLATIPVMSASPIPLVEEVRRHPDVLLMEVDYC